MVKQYEPLKICIDGINLVVDGSPIWTQDKYCKPNELADVAQMVGRFSLAEVEHNYHDALECNVDAINYACVKTSSDILTYNVLFNEMIDRFPPRESELYNGNIIRMLVNEIGYTERLRLAYSETFCAFFEDNPERLIRLRTPAATIDQLLDTWKDYSDQLKRMILHWIAAFIVKPQRHKGIHPFWYYACGLSKKWIERLFEGKLANSVTLCFHYQDLQGYFQTQAQMFLAKDPDQASIAVASFEKENRAAEARFRKWEKRDAYERFEIHGCLVA